MWGIGGIAPYIHKLSNSRRSVQRGGLDAVEKRRSSTPAVNRTPISQLSISCLVTARTETTCEASSRVGSNNKISDCAMFCVHN